MTDNFNIPANTLREQPIGRWVLTMPTGRNDGDGRKDLPTVRIRARSGSTTVDLDLRVPGHETAEDFLDLAMLGEAGLFEALKEQFLGAAEEAANTNS